MTLEYRRANAGDIETCVRLRMLQLREENPATDAALIPALRDYYHRHMAAGDYLGWLALADGHAVGAGGVSIVEKPPYAGCPTGRIALLSGMYTAPEWRRRGVARAILERLTADARAQSCGAVQITGSDAGVKLYAAFGFEHNPNFMFYRLD